MHQETFLRCPGCHMHRCFHPYAPIVSRSYVETDKHNEFLNVVLSVVFSLVLCLVMRSRRSRQHQEQQAIAAVYQVDATQIQGPPPTTYVTSFDPRSAAAYPHTPDPVSSIPGTAKTAQFPATQQRYVGKYGVKPPSTAPVNQAYGTGSYPFPGYSPVSWATFVRQGSTLIMVWWRSSQKLAPVQQPHTAFSSGFPRPLYTGQPVQKDDLREVHKDTV